MPRQDGIQMTPEQIRERINTLKDSEITAFNTKKVDLVTNPMLSDIKQTRKDVALLDNVLGDLQTTADLQITAAEKSRLTSIRARGRSHLLLNERSFWGDSPEMKEVKFRVGIVERMLDEMRAEPLSKELYEKIEVSYQLAINACDTYLNNPKKNKNNRRYNAVLSTRLALFGEAGLLETNRSGLDDGKLKDKTIADVLSLSKTSGVLVKRKRNTDEEPKEISEVGYSIATLFSNGYMPNKSVTEAGSSTKSRMKAVREIKKIKDNLRSIKEGKVICVDVELAGHKVKLLQRADNKLYLIEGHMQFPLELSAARLADKIEADMASNYEIYGNEAVHGMFSELSIVDMEQKRTAGENQRIRQICLDYLTKSTGIGAPEFNNISQETVLRYAREFSEGTLSIGELKSRLQQNADLDKMMINSNETLELIRAGKERKKSRVEFKEKTEENIDPALVEEGREWSKKEQQLLDMFADIIFDKRSWNTDANVGKNIDHTEAIRRRLANHKEALYTLLRDPATVNEMINKLEIPGAVNKDNQPITEALKTGYAVLSALMLPLQTNTEGTFNSNVIDSIVGEEVGDLNAFLGLKTVYTKEFVLEKLQTFFSCIDSQVEEITDNLQKTVSKAAEDLFGESDPNEVLRLNIGTKKKQENEEENGEGNEENQQQENQQEQQENQEQQADNAAKKKEVKKNNDPPTLQSMMEDLVKGKKGAGRFNKLVLNNYFDSVSMLDKQSMVASMVRNLKPKGWAQRSMSEYCKELRASRKYVSLSYFFNENHLRDEEKEIIKAYEAQNKAELLSGNMLGGILKGAGPLMHKIMQGLPVTSMPLSLREALKDMKSNLAPIPREVVEAQLNSMVERSKGSIERIEVIKSLGAASIAQTFLCKCYGRDFPNGREVAVKLLRPDVKNRMEREKDIMIECAKATDESGGMYATYMGTLRNVEREMDFTIESDYVKQGKIYNNRHKDVKSMELNDIISATTSSMVAERASGTTVDKYLEEIDKKIEDIKSRFYYIEKVPVRGDDGKILKDAKGKDITKDVLVKQCVSAIEKQNEVVDGVKQLRKEMEILEKRRNHVCNLADIWVREGMLKSGFYHGDLHAGNIMIDDDTATIIDFGNSTQVKPKQQKYIIGMLRAAMEGDTNLFMECFKELLGRKDDEFIEFFNEAKQAELKEAFREVLSMGTEEDTGERIMVSLLRAQELGVEIPASIWGFAQGQNRLMNCINEMNAKMQTIENAIGELEKMGSAGIEDYVDPIMLVQDVFRRQSIGEEDKKRDMFDKVIFDLEREVDERQMLKELDDTKINDNLEIDKISDFEEKYLKDYRYVRYGLIEKAPANDVQGGNVQGGNVQGGNVQKENYQWHSEAWGNGFVGYYDYKAAIQGYRDFVNEWRNKGGKDNPEFNEAAIDLLIKYPLSKEMLAPFGGNNMLTEMQEALTDFTGNGSAILALATTLEQRIPIVTKMVESYEEFRLAQQKKAGSSRLRTLKNRFIENYRELSAFGNDKIQLLSEFRQGINSFDKDDAAGEEKKEAGRDKAIEKLAKLEEDQDLAKEFLDNYKSFKVVKNKVNKNEALTQEEIDKYGDANILVAKKKAEEDFVESYRKIAVKRLRNYRNNLYSELTKEPEENDFLRVMSKILKGPIVVAQMAWKVRYKLGWRIFRAEANAKKQRKEYAKKKEQERQALEQQMNADNIQELNGDNEDEGEINTQQKNVKSVNTVNKVQPEIIG